VPASDPAESGEPDLRDVLIAPTGAIGDHPGMSNNAEHRTVDFPTALVALDRAYTGVRDLTASLSRHDLLAFSRCHGWVVADVLFHLLCDAQRALVALASPASGPPDRDFVTYWTGFAAEADDPAPAAWWVRRSAAAFRDGTGAVALWRETAPAAVRAAGRADPGGYITTQGHLLAVPDFLTTLVTEAVIHHLDMTVQLTAAPGPDARAVALATRTLDGLLGSDVSRPDAWTAEEYLLKGTGRAPLSARDHDTLAGAAERFPLLS
jgi:Mycothiol maleylpyruvate isomerase N-terminal domain